MSNSADFTNSRGQRRWDTLRSRRKSCLYTWWPSTASKNMSMKVIHQLRKLGVHHFRNLLFVFARYCLKLAIGSGIVFVDLIVIAIHCSCLMMFELRWRRNSLFLFLPVEGENGLPLLVQDIVAGLFNWNMLWFNVSYHDPTWAIKIQHQKKFLQKSLDNSSKNPSEIPT